MLRVETDHLWPIIETLKIGDSKSAIIPGSVGKGRPFALIALEYL